MSKIVPTPPPGFDELSVDEQIDFVQSLWERIAATPEQVPVPEWHRRIIRERLEAYKANPTHWSTLDRRPHGHRAQVARSLI